MSRRPVPVAGIISRELDGQLVLISPENGKIRVLNAAGALIWQEMQKGEDSAAIAASLTATFGISLEAATVDVARFIDDLRTRGLLSVPPQ